MDFEKFKETVTQDLLKKLPQLENAGIEFRDVEKLQNQSYTALNITPEQLHQDAMEQAPLTHPASIRNLAEVMMGLLGKSFRKESWMNSLPCL